MITASLMLNSVDPLSVAKDTEYEGFYYSTVHCFHHVSISVNVSLSNKKMLRMCGGACGKRTSARLAVFVTVMSVCRGHRGYLHRIPE